MQVGQSHETQLGAAAAVASTKAATIDDETIGAVRKNGSGGIKQVDKRSLDYILRSGLAGGLAGCAVSREYRSFQAYVTVVIYVITLHIAVYGSNR